MERANVESENARYLSAIARGVREAVLENYRLGLPVPVWRNEQVEWVNAAEFVGSTAEPVETLDKELRALPPDKLLLAAAYIRQLRDS